MPEEQKKKKNAAKVLLLVMLLFIVLGALGAVTYFVSKNYRQLERYNDAMTAYDSENWELAEKRLTDAILEDPNNEEVVSKLATVNEKLNKWVEAGLLWKQAAELNAFKPEYLEQSLNAYFRAGSLSLLQNELSSMQALETDRHRLLLAFTHTQTGEIEQARNLMEELSAPEALNSPLGELVSLFVEETPDLASVRNEKLEELAKSEDPSIALYALYELADTAIEQGEMERAEAYLKLRVPLNPKLGTMSLANFYYIQGKSETAAKYYRESIDELIPIEAIRLAESLIAIDAIDELKELVKRYRVGARADILTGYYMDALLAYQNGDAATVSAKMEALGNELPVTPVAQLLSFYDTTQRKDVEGLIELLSKFPYNAKERLSKYATLITPLVAELISENKLADASQISELLILRNLNDVTFTVAVIGNASQKQLLSRIDLDQALESYPDEPKLWSIAAEFHLRNGDFIESKRAADELLRIIPGNISGQLLQISALESMQKVTEASTAFESLYDENQSDRKVLIQYLAFCLRNQLSGNLSRLITSLKNSPETAPHGAALLAEAELANLAQDRETVYAALIQVVKDPQLAVSLDNAAILYRVANLLATYDYADPAIKLYRKLLTFSPNAVPVLVNLSELYAAQAQQQPNDGTAAKEALALALQAYTAVPKSEIVRECYAIRLYENGSYEEAQKLLLSFIQKGTKSPRIREAWKGSMQHLIQELAIEEEIYKRSNLSKLLLNEFPGNEVAIRNLQSIEEEIQRRADEATAKKTTTERSK